MDYKAKNSSFCYIPLSEEELSNVCYRGLTLSAPCLSRCYWKRRVVLNPMILPTENGLTGPDSRESNKEQPKLSDEPEIRPPKQI